MIHTYSANQEERRAFPYYLAVAATVITLILHSSLLYFGFGVGAWVYLPTNFAIYCLLYYSLDRFLWKITILQDAGLVKIPNLNGRWSGELRSSHSQYQTQHNVTLIITQTWATLSIKMESDKSTSWSSMASIDTLSTSDIELSWEYRAEAKRPDERDFNHRGVTRLVFNRSPQSLISKISGIYYTQHDRDTNGIIDLRP